MKLDEATRNAMLDAIETVTGTAPILRIRSGSPPANVAAASSGTVLAQMTLPSDWLAAASGGTKAKSGTWEDLTADANGTAGHYEITSSDGTTRRQQGTCTVTGGGGDMELVTLNIVAGQPVEVTAYTLTAGNA